MREAPAVSVVIPTHNRAASLLRTLAALSRQTYPQSLTEVIVVADGCTDDTTRSVRELTTTYRLVLINQNNLGPSGARNAGAAHATGSLLIFLDDDVEPSKDLVGAHVLRHRRSAVQDLVVLGYYPTRITFQTGLFRAALLNWWESIFDAMEAPAHRFRHVDMLSGNVSIGRDLFMRIGGFDREMRCHEDYELGVRLIKAGAAFAFERQAWGHHFETSDMARSLSRKFEEGRADVQLARKHPELLPQLPLSRRGRGMRIFRALSWTPGMDKLLEATLSSAQAGAEALRMRSLWLRLFYRRVDIAYWKGARKEAGIRALLSVLREPAPVHPVQPLPEIDLREGIEAVEAQLDAARPAGLVVRYGEEIVGTLPFDAHRERIHGGHLRPWLATTHVHQLVTALGGEVTRAGAFGAPPVEFRAIQDVRPEGPFPSHVSVVIPARNAAATLPATLECLLAQSHPQWDAIVVDDGSTDATSEIIKSFMERDPRFDRVRVEAGSASAARNAGVQRSRGEWLLFLDADDSIDSFMLERMVAALAADREAKAAHCGWRCLAPSGELILEQRNGLSGDHFPVPSLRAPFAIHACVIARNVAIEAGLFDPALRTNEDFDFWQRVARLGTRFVSVPDTMVTYNMRASHGWFEPARNLEDALPIIARGHVTQPTDARSGSPRESLAQHVYYVLAYNAGAAIARGADPSALFDRVADFMRTEQVGPAATLVPDTCADGLLTSIHVAHLRGQESWPELWKGVVQPVEAVLQRLEQGSGFEGLAAGAMRALERKVAALLTGDGHIGGAYKATIVADAPLEAHRFPEGNTLIAKVEYGGVSIGTIRLPICDDAVAPDVLKDAICAEFSWLILGVYLSRREPAYQGHFPRLEKDAKAQGLGPELTDLHNRIGWRILLQHVWNLPEQELDMLYDPVPAPTATTRSEPLTRVTVGDLRPVKHPGPTAALRYEFAGEPEAAFLVGTTDGEISPQRAAAVFTQEAGFDLCRIVVRAAILGRAIDDPASLAERLLNPHEERMPNAAVLGRWPHIPSDVWQRRVMLPLSLLDELSRNPVAAENLTIPEGDPAQLVYRPGLVRKAGPLTASGPAAAHRPYTELVRDHFEALFATGPDPWKYTSNYEQTKYDQTLSLIPAEGVDSALELACAEGHFTTQLAPRVKHLDAVDVSERALQRARVRNASRSNIAFARLDLAKDAIEGRYDLIVCSEVLYYLEGRDALNAVVDRIASALKSGGRFVHAHANVLVDDPSSSGFDWTVPFGAKVIAEAITAHPRLHLDEELVTPLYRVQRFIVREPGKAPRPTRSSSASYAIPEPEVSERIRWGGGYVQAGLAGRDMTEAAPILMYHRIAPVGGGALDRYSVDPVEFEAQLAYLAEAGYRSATLPEWRRACRTKRPLPGKRVILTFDDGYADFADNAWPLLKRYGFQPTVFLVTDLMGDRARWDQRYGKSAPLLSWEQVGRLSGEGVVFGSHGASHRSFATLSHAELGHELLRSRQIIEQHTGKPVTSLCYPYGQFTPETALLAVGCGYCEAVSVTPGKSLMTDDPMAFRRIEARSGQSLESFKQLVGSAEQR